MERLVARVFAARANVVGTPWRDGGEEATRWRRTCEVPGAPSESDRNTSGSAFGPMKSRCKCAGAGVGRPDCAEWRSGPTSGFVSVFCSPIPLARLAKSGAKREG
jgi:hypothetical protein